MKYEMKQQIVAGFNKDMDQNDELNNDEMGGAHILWVLRRLSCHGYSIQYEEFLIIIATNPFSFQTLPIWLHMI